MIKKILLCAVLSGFSFSVLAQQSSQLPPVLLKTVSGLHAIELVGALCEWPEAEKRRVAYHVTYSVDTLIQTGGYSPNDVQMAFDQIAPQMAEFVSRTGIKQFCVTYGPAAKKALDSLSAK